MSLLNPGSTLPARTFSWISAGNDANSSGFFLMREAGVEQPASQRAAVSSRAVRNGFMTGNVRRGAGIEKKEETRIMPP